MPYAARGRDRLYYELTGPEDGPVVIQFGGGLFGRHNFGAVNDGFRENGFRLLSFDARGYGASSAPRELYTIEMWAPRRRAAPRRDRARESARPRTSMGGMIAIAFAAPTAIASIATCADVAFAKPDVYRRTLFRVWREWPRRCRGTTSPITSPHRRWARAPRERRGRRHVRPRPRRDRPGTTRTPSVRHASRWRRWTGRPGATDLDAAC